MWHVHYHLILFMCFGPSLFHYRQPLTQYVSRKYILIHTYKHKPDMLQLYITLQSVLHASMIWFFVFCSMLNCKTNNDFFPLQILNISISTILRTKESFPLHQRFFFKIKSQENYHFF